MSDKLKDLRRQIDGLDKQMLSLLAKRASVALRIGKEKAKTSDQTHVIHPERETALIRTLLNQADESFPKKSIFRIWREIMGGSALLQNPDLSIAVLHDESRCNPADMRIMQYVREHFSNAIPIKSATNALIALSMVREEDATFAILPYPEDGETQPWWISMLDDTTYHNMNVIGRLPFHDQSAAHSYLDHNALIVAKTPFLASAETFDCDRTFLVVSSQKALSRGSLIEKFSAMSLNVSGIFMHHDQIANTFYSLVEVAGFVPQTSEGGDALQETFEDGSIIMYNIGGYPEPSIF